MSDAVYITVMPNAGPLMTNYYVVGCTETKEAAIIDAGWDGAKLVSLAADRDFSVTKILQTHAHIDHVAGIHAARSLSNAPIHLHPDDQFLWDSAPEQGRFFGYEIDALPDVDESLADGQLIALGSLSCRVMLLPGHSPGSVAFWFEDLGVVFGGDVLFAGSIGRVDLPGSNPEEMKRSLERMTTELPDETRVLPGHGPETSIGMEKKRNPFLLQSW